MDTETVAVNGNGTVHDADRLHAADPGRVTGTYQWNAIYSGDANNNAASDTAPTEQVMVARPARRSAPPPTRPPSRWARRRDPEGLGRAAGRL